MQKVSGAVSVKPKQKKALITLLVIFGIAMLGNILLTLYYLNFLKQDFHFFLAIGLLVAQPCILSIWCALGGQRAVVRIPAFMGMLALLFIVYTGILVSSGAPGSFVSILGVCVIAITVIIQIPLWIFRASTKQVVALPSQTESGIGASQFGIRHLFISTTIAAIVVTVAQANAQYVSFDPTPFPGPGLILFVTFFVIVASVLSFLILAVVFNRNHRLAFVGLLAVILLVLPLPAVEAFHCMWRVPAFQWNVDEIFNAFCFVFSLTVGMIGVLYIFYSIGFRVQKINT